MNYYETLYIVHPALDSGRIKEMVLSVNKTLESMGGKPVSLDVWGKKKLAYEIDKQKYGTYVLVQFTGDGSGNAKFNQELEHNPNILSYLTTRIDEEKLNEQTVELDDQLSGSSPSSSSASETKVEKPAQETSDTSSADKDETSNTDDSTADDSSSEEVKVSDEPSEDESSEDKAEESNETDEETKSEESNSDTAEESNDEEDTQSEASDESSDKEEE